MLVYINNVIIFFRTIKKYIKYFNTIFGILAILNCIMALKKYYFA